MPYLAIALFFGLPVLLALFGVGLYNRLVALRNRHQNAFSQIDVQLKRRYELIPNLVEVARGYLRHERETLEAVIQARNSAFQAHKALGEGGDAGGAMQRLAAAEGVLGGSLGRLLAVAEGYPDLKGNQNMQALMEELSSTENRIAAARQAYNDAVMVFNTQRESFPASAIAGMFRFEPASLFELEDQVMRQAPKVSFG
jgi:LemA protein